MARRRLTRRQFVEETSAMALGGMVVKRHVLGGPGYQAPSDTLNVAIVGAGGMGMGNAEALGTQNIVAVCDVDFGYVERALTGREKDREGKPRPEGIRLQEQFGKAARYADFREMLDKQKNIEAVLVATPDHTHAVIANAAMLAGKHVYVQKPLTYSVHEARVLRATAAKTGVATQMGNQGHSRDEARIINEWIQAGVIGPVAEVHVWTNRPIWPQGIPRPAAAPVPPAPAPGAVPAPPSWNRRTINEATAAAMMGNYSAPEGLRWDLYLGPVPEDLPWHPVYHPFNWRGWTDFGVGALGDMGAHLIDHPVWALNLGYPSSIEATSTPWGGPSAKPATYPVAMTVHYEFPARGNLPAVKLNWYDGGLMPPRPPQLPDDLALNREGGVLYVGTKGILIHETYGTNPKLFPAGLLEDAAKVPQTMPRVTVSHELNWVAACKKQGTATSPFEYAAPLTETMLLGIVALRTGQGRKILYDGAAMSVTNIPEANQYLTRQYRDGWGI